jgi:hypothetical protein
VRIFNSTPQQTKLEEMTRKCIYFGLKYIIIGGNQRDLARLKNAKKQQELKKSAPSAEKAGNSGARLETRQQRDAEIMRQKQEKKAAELLEKKDNAPSSSSAKK